LGAVLSASASLAREIRSGTALAVLSKPVGRAQFLLAKYVGLAVALDVIDHGEPGWALLASRMAFRRPTVDGPLRRRDLRPGPGNRLPDGRFSNFFLRRPFVSDAVFCVALMAAVAFVVINFYTKEAKPQAFATGVDWQMVPGRAVDSLCGLDPCGPRAGLLDPVRHDPDLGDLFRPVPAGHSCRIICSAGGRTRSGATISRPKSPVPGGPRPRRPCSGRWCVNTAGARRQTEPGLERGPGDQQRLAKAGMGGSKWASVLYTVTPNWHFLARGCPEAGKSTFHWGYVAKAFAYAAGYIGAALACAVLLFEERELS